MNLRVASLLVLLALLGPYMQVAQGASGTGQAFASTRIPDVEEVLAQGGLVSADAEAGLVLVAGGFGARLYSVNGSLVWSGLEDEPVCAAVLLGHDAVAVFTAAGLEEYWVGDGGLLWVDPGHSCPSVVDGSSGGAVAAAYRLRGGDKLVIVGPVGAWKTSIEVNGSVVDLKWSPGGDWLAVLYRERGTGRGVLEVLDATGQRVYRSPSGVMVYGLDWSPGGLLAAAYGARGVLLLDPRSGEAKTVATLLRAATVAWLNSSSIIVLDAYRETFAIIGLDGAAEYGVLPLHGVLSSPSVQPLSNGFAVAGVLSSSPRFAAYSLIVRVEHGSGALSFYTVKGRLLALAEGNGSLVAATTRGLYLVDSGYTVEKVPLVPAGRVEAATATPGLALVVYSTGGPIGERLLKAIRITDGGVEWAVPVPRVRSLEPSRDGRYLALVSADQGLYVVRLDDGRLLWSLDGVYAAAWSSGSLFVLRSCCGESFIEEYDVAGRLVSAARLGLSILVGVKLLASIDGWAVVADGRLIEVFAPGLHGSSRIVLEDYPWRLEIGPGGSVYALLSDGLHIYSGGGDELGVLGPENTPLERIRGFTVSEETGLVAVAGWPKTGSYTGMLAVYSPEGRLLWSRGFDTSVEPVAWFQGDTLLVYKSPPFCSPSSLIAYSSDGAELFTLKGGARDAYLDSSGDERVVVFTRDAVYAAVHGSWRALADSKLVEEAVVAGDGVLELVLDSGGSKLYMGFTLSTWDLVFNVSLGSAAAAVLRPGGGAAAVVYYRCRRESLEAWSVLATVDRGGNVSWRKRIDDNVRNIVYSRGRLVAATSSVLTGLDEATGDALYTIRFSGFIERVAAGGSGYTAVAVQGFDDTHYLAIYRYGEQVAVFPENGSITRIGLANGTAVYIVEDGPDGLRLVAASYGNGAERLWEKSIRGVAVGLQVEAGLAAVSLAGGETLVYNASTGMLEHAVAPLYGAQVWDSALYHWRGGGLDAVVLSDNWLHLSLAAMDSGGFAAEGEALLLHEAGDGGAVLVTSSGVFHVEPAGEPYTAMAAGIPPGEVAVAVSGGSATVLYGDTLVVVEASGGSARLSTLGGLGFIPARASGYTVGGGYLAVYSYDTIAVYEWDGSGYRLVDVVKPPGGWVTAASLSGRVLAVFTEKAVLLYKLPGLAPLARVAAPRGYLVRGGGLEGDALVVVYGKHRVVEKPGGVLSLVCCTSVAVGIYTVEGGEKALHVFNASGVGRTGWIGPGAYLVQLLGGGIYLFDARSGDAVGLAETGDALLWAAGLGSGYALGFMHGNETLVKLVTRAGAEEASYITSRAYVRLLGSSGGKLLLQDKRGVLSVLDASTGEATVYQKLPAGTLRVLWSGGAEAVLIGEDIRRAKLKGYAVVAILYSGEPVNLALTEAVFNSTVRKGFKLFISPGSWSLSFSPTEPKKLEATLGAPEWYTRLTYTVELEAESGGVYIIHTPGEDDFASLAGRIILVNNATEDYTCTVAWGQGEEHLHLSPGSRAEANALPGDYTIRCTSPGGESLETSAKVEQEKNTTIIINCTRAQATPATTTTTVTKTTTVTSPVTKTITITETETRTQTLRETVTETGTHEATVTVTAQPPQSGPGGGANPAWAALAAALAAVIAYYLGRTRGQHR